MPTGRWLNRMVVGLSGVSILLVVAYIVLVQDNRSVQAEVNRRQQFINQSVQLGHINEMLIRTLAASAVSNKDDKLRDLLTQNGVTINAAGEAVPSSSIPSSSGPSSGASPEKPAPAAGTGRGP